MCLLLAHLNHLGTWMNSSDGVTVCCHNLAMKTELIWAATRLHYLLIFPFCRRPHLILRQPKSGYPWRVEPLFYMMAFVASRRLLHSLTRPIVTTELTIKKWAKTTLLFVTQIHPAVCFAEPSFPCQKASHAFFAAALSLPRWSESYAHDHYFDIVSWDPHSFLSILQDNSLFVSDSTLASVLKSLSSVCRT